MNDTTAQKSYFVALRGIGENVAHACELVGITRSTYYQWRNGDPDFARACDEAIQDFTARLHVRVFGQAPVDSLESVSRRRWKCCWLVFLIVTSLTTLGLAIDETGLRAVFVFFAGVSLVLSLFALSELRDQFR